MKLVCFSFFNIQLKVKLVCFSFLAFRFSLFVFRHSNSGRISQVPFLTPLVWRDRGANPRRTTPEADALTTRLSGPVSLDAAHIM